MLAEDSLDFVLLYTLRYFHDFTNFNRFVIANFSQAINKPFATLQAATVVSSKMEIM
jgi:hypothetical protein